MSTVSHNLKVLKMLTKHNHVFLLISDHPLTVNEGVDSAASPEENCTSLKKGTCMAAASIQLDGGRGEGWHMRDGGRGRGEG